MVFDFLQIRNALAPPLANPVCIGRAYYLIVLNLGYLLFTIIFVYNLRYRTS